MSRSSRPEAVEAANEVGAWLAGIGILTMSLFPFALPALLFGLVAIAPLLVLVAVAALLAVVVGLPSLLVWLVGRQVVRLARGRRRRAVAT